MRYAVSHDGFVMANRTDTKVYDRELLQASRRSGALREPHGNQAINLDGGMLRHNSL